MYSREKLTMFVALAIAAVAITPPAFGGCHDKAVRIRTFFGQPADLNSLLGELPANSVDARVQVFIVESPQGAEVLYLEHVEGDEFETASWYGSALGDIRSTFDQHFLESRGQACAGELMKQEMDAAGIRLEPAGAVEHASHVETLAPVLSRYEGEYVRLTVYDPCI